MSASAGGSGGGAALELRPLAPESLAPAVQKLVAGPPPAKAMAAKGLAPMRPAELVTAIYQLSFDADAAVKAAAEAAPAALPDRIVVPGLGEALAPEVLHFFGVRLAAGRTEALEKILYNGATADATFVALAGRLKERELEVIFQNEARLLRTPAILEALYMNREARMSSLNRAIELCARNGVRPDGIPGFDDIVKSLAEDRSAQDPTVDQAFAGILAAADAAPPVPEGPAEAGEGAGTPAAAAAPPAAAPERDRDRKGGVIDFTKLKLHEKIRLATLGNEYCRQNLIRDPNRVVALAVIRSPRITDGEIVRAAGNRTVSEDVIRYIANQRELLKIYAVKHNLVQNPKCPLAFSLKILPLLLGEDLKEIARSKNVPSALSTAARKLMTTRGSGRGG
jgi:hypothetical protein